MSAGQRIGYVRVSSTDQNTARQLEGVSLDEVFEDKASGKNTDRPGLESLRRHVRRGDHIYVHSMDRLARSLRDLISLVDEFRAKGVTLTFVTERLTYDPGDTSPQGQLMLSIFGAFGEFERAISKARQREGIEEAKRRGVYKGGTNRLEPKKVERIQKLVSEGRSVAEIAKELCVSRQTVYSYTPEKDRGEFRGGSNKVDPDRIVEIKARLAKGESPTAISKALGVSRQTVYTYGK